MVSGLRFAVLYDWSVAHKLVLSAVVLMVALVIRSWVDFQLILVVTALVLVAEIVNSAIEAVCDFVKESHNHKTKVIKDMVAVVVGIIMFDWVVVFGVELTRLAAEIADRPTATLSTK